MSEFFYKMTLAMIGFLIFLFFIIIIIIIFHIFFEGKNEIKEEKKEFDKKLDFIKYKMKEEEKKEFENIVNCLPKKGKKKLVDTIYNQKFEENLKRYEKVSVKE